MELAELKKLLSEKRPNDWDDIPDIDLYMDQVIGYMQRQHMGFEAGETITPAMINNYVKQQVMPKPAGKRYSREHIAYITAIALLKQVISVGEVKTLLDSQLSGEDIEGFYKKYQDRLDEEANCVDGMIGSEMTEEELSELALELAVSAYTRKLACECILDMIGGEDENKKKKK